MDQDMIVILILDQAGPVSVKVSRATISNLITRQLSSYFLCQSYNFLFFFNILLM